MDTTNKSEASMERSFYTIVESESVDDFDIKNNIINGIPPTNGQWSASYKKCFAYPTFRERVPRIIEDIITTVQRDQDELICRYGKIAKFDVQRVTTQLKHLLKNIAENKDFELFYSKEPDAEHWNASINDLYSDKNNWFTAEWLFAETYLYRRISSYFKRTESLNTYDYFAKIKQDALFQNRNAMLSVVMSTRTLPRNEKTFRKLLRLQVWGNRCDLSITKDTYGSNAFEELTDKVGKLLVDQSAGILDCLTSLEHAGIIYVDIICDNAGFELFTDLIMAEYLITHNLADRIRFHVKAIPWYVSDATADDYHWTLRFLRQDKDLALRRLGRKFTKYTKDQKFVVVPTQYFWTSPHGYSKMRDICACLYVELSSGALSIFKGDLNYRKLVGDRNWESTKSFTECLRGFYPTNIVALRAIKSEILCGMPCCVAPALTVGKPNWMYFGEYGVLHFFKKELHSFSTIA